MNVNDSTSSDSMLQRLRRPFAEVDQELLRPKAPPIPAPCNHVNCNECWNDYPRSRFPNWGDSQISRSGLCDAINKYNHDVPCTIHRVDVDNRGYFMDSEKHEVTEQTRGDFWELLIERHVRTLLSSTACFIQSLLRG